MFKAGVIAFAISVAAGGTAFWLNAGIGAKSEGPALAGMPSIQDMYDKAHLKGLPVQEVRDPF
jgi:hypothetical protein